MQQGFDRIAPFYDLLARLVFGKSIRRCQLEYLNKIQSGSNVLILGGGTGWILSELTKINPACRVYYLEASEKMLEIAKARFDVSHSNQIVFTHGTETNLDQISNIRFDSVITNFYLDLFETAELASVLRRIKMVITPESQLLISEFVDRRWWQRVLLFLMYQFFSWTCSVEAKSLPQWEDQLRINGFAEHSSRWFYFGFIKSCLFGLDKEARP